ncbi:MAG: mycothiol transferase [Streptosporangiaceae bacterium]
MTLGDLLADAFGRIRGIVHDVTSGLTDEQLAFRPAGQANSITWLVWHLTRIQDDHVAAVAGTEQAWTAEGWADRFGLPYRVTDTGYGHSPDQVAACRAPAGLLTGYHDAVYRNTVSYVEGLTEPGLDRVVDPAWDPPVTLGVRLVSVISDDLQHAGQAAYLRGLLVKGWDASDI